ncbi:MobC family plasmid mobilization relaxosome protein [Salmonella enterica]|nr:MobC family plasmid mobilization relaxosome protein [Salmonella enterica]
MAVERKHVISVRLTEEEYEPFKKILESTEVSKSEFFRMVLLSRVSDLPTKPKVTPEYKRCLFFFNKTSNNINQIAKRINIDAKKGAVTDSTYRRIMNTLISINALLSGALE